MSWLVIINVFEPTVELFHYTYTPLTLLIPISLLSHAAPTFVSAFVWSPGPRSSWPAPLWRWRTGWLDVHLEGWHIMLFAAITVHFWLRAPWPVNAEQQQIIYTIISQADYHTSFLCCSCLSLCGLRSAVCKADTVLPSHPSLSQCSSALAHHTSLHMFEPSFLTTPGLL